MQVNGTQTCIYTEQFKHYYGGGTISFISLDLYMKWAHQCPKSRLRSPSPVSRPVMPQKFNKIFITILLYIPGMN